MSRTGIILVHFSALVTFVVQREASVYANFYLIAKWHEYRL